MFNPGVIVGKNVDCLNGVLLGQIDSGVKAGTPVIGDNVFLGSRSFYRNWKSREDNTEAECH